MDGPDIRPRDDMVPNSGASDTLHRVTFPFKWVADCLTRRSIPDWNSVATGPRGDVQPIRRVSSRLYDAIMQI